MNAPQTQNPVLGVILSVVAFITGKLPETKLVSNATDYWLYVDPATQDLITFYFSNIAFFVSIAAAIFSFINWMVKKIKKEKSHAKV